MLRKVQAILLRTVKYSETSIICDAFTLELGLRTYIISGVRKKNAKVSPALVRPMSLVEMVVYHHDEKDINRIKEIKPSYIYQQIPFDIYKGTIGLFLTEIAQKTIKETSENIPLFNFLQSTYETLDKTKDSVANFPIWFLGQYATHLGITPDIAQWQEGMYYDYKESKLMTNLPNHSAYFDKDYLPWIVALQQHNYLAVEALKIPLMARKQLLHQYLTYYQYHIESFGVLNSLVVLQEVF